MAVSVLFIPQKISFMIGYSQHDSITRQLIDLIKEVEDCKKQVDRGIGGQELAVLHTDLRKCLAWTREIPAEEDEVDKTSESHDDGPQ